MSAQPLAVAVVGAGGRLGVEACALLRATPGFELVAAYGSRDDWRGLVAGSGARVALEATRAGLGVEHALALLEAGVRPLVATSGVDPQACAGLDARARELGLGGLVAPNLSLGALLMLRFSELAARHFARAEIVEAHRPEKADAPSGTARETARRIAQAGTGDGAHEVPIHSLRQSGVYAEQEVAFEGEGELLRISHRMRGPGAFGPGILAGLRHAATADGVGYGLELAMPLAGPAGGEAVAFPPKAERGR